MKNPEDLQINDKLPVVEKEPKIRASFAVVLNGKGEILLHLRADGLGWDLPGGGREKIGGKKESPKETLLRETEEETGLKVRILGISKKFVNPEKSKATMVYLCAVESGELRVSHESTEVRFFPFDQLPETLLPKQRVRIWEVLAERKLITKNEIRSVEN